MKNARTQAGRFLLAMSSGLLFVGADAVSAVEITPQLRAAALQVIPDAGANNTAIEHCGCDRKEGIQMYVQNLINDAEKRGLNCQTSYHIPACITTYCSICNGHPGLVENCIQTGIAYFTSTANFCSQQTNGVAAAEYRSDMPFLGQMLQ
jgi:hypothetical protein